MNAARVLLVDGSRGIYSAQALAGRDLDLELWHLTNNVDDLQTLLDGPENPEYLEAFDAVLNAAFRIDESGTRWTLESVDGDIFATVSDDA